MKELGRGREKSKEGAVGTRKRNSIRTSLSERSHKRGISLDGTRPFLSTTLSNRRRAVETERKPGREEEQPPRGTAIDVFGKESNCEEGARKT